MAIASDSFTGVDLSRLPAPTIIEPLDFETIYATALAWLQANFPGYDAIVESDPGIKLTQLFAYRELLLRQRINEAARAVMPAYAIGADLDGIAAAFGIERFILDPGNPDLGIAPTYESDTDFRRRMVLAPEGYSVAGPEGAYIFHALSADADVLDASAASPEPDDIKALVLGVLEDHGAAPALVTAMTAALEAAVWPGEVIVSILSRSGDGSAAPDLIATVDAYLSDEQIRPLTDHVITQSAEIVPYAIEAAITTFSGPDSSVVLATASARLDAYVDASHRMGRDITRSGILAALHVEGVQNVVLTSPAVDIVISRTQAPHCTGITITYAGIAE